MRKVRNMLHEKRIENGISQKELAEKVGCNAGTLSRYEYKKTDINNMSLEMAIRLANALDTTVTELFTIPPTEPRTVYRVCCSGVVQFALGKVKVKKGFTKELEKYPEYADDKVFDSLEKALAHLETYKSWITVINRYNEEKCRLVEAQEYYVEGEELDEFGDFVKNCGDRIYAGFYKG